MEEPPTQDVLSIYDDLLCQGDLGLVIHNLQTRNKQLQLHVTSLEEDIRKLCNKITEMKQTQENLSRNISELYKTAKNEIERKDRMIAELQSKLDDIVFRRNTAPSNFGIKRQREEQSHPEEMFKKSRCDEVIENKEQKKDIFVEKIESSRSEHYDRKSDFEFSKKSNSHDHMKLKDNVRIEERRPDSRDHSSRYEGDSRRSSNSREGGYRRDSRNVCGRDYKDNGKSSKDRDYKVGRFVESREPKNKNGRLRDDRSNKDRGDDRSNRDRGDDRSNRDRGDDRSNRDRGDDRSKKDRGDDRSTRERGRISDEREDLRRNRKFDNEPRFSPVESTRSTPEPPLGPNDGLNISKEEGEVSDGEEEKQKLPSNKRKFTNDSKKKNSEKSTISFDNKTDPPCDILKPFNVSEYIDKQHKIIQKKETGIKNIERCNNRKHSISKDVKSDIQHVDEIHIDRELKKNECMLKEKKIKGIIPTKDNINVNSVEGSEIKLTSTDDDIKNKHAITTRESTTVKDSIEGSEIKPTSSIDKDLIDEKGETSKRKQERTEKITIISQVVLNEAKNEDIESNVATRVKTKEMTEILTKEVIRIENDREKKVGKVDKPTRECGVPRNLTGELNIHVEKALPKHTNKDKESNTDKTERVQKKISSLFDTPIKESTQSQEKSLNFKQNFELTHEGGIPSLEFEKFCPKETSSSQSGIGVKETLTPVSEFQIFKTNLSSLDKSNSASIQFQQNICNVTMKNTEVPTQKTVETEKYNASGEKCVDKCLEPKASAEILQKHTLEDLVNIGQPVVKNENIGYGSTSEMCNISLDLLNANLGLYKVEDFPNLTAFSESKDMPHILLTPVSNPSKKAVEKGPQTSSQLIDFENMLKETNPAPNILTEQKVVLKEKISSENISNVQSNDISVGKNSVNLLLSPSSGDSRKKRRRCVIKWAE